MDEKGLSKTLRTAIKTGKVIIGTKEAIHSLKGSKLVVYSSSPSFPLVSELVKACKDLSMPLLEYEGSSIELGRLCGKPFPISVIVVKAAGEADLSALLG